MNNSSNTTKQFNLSNLDINEINTIISGLMELPGKISLGLYTKIREQVQKQIEESSSSVPAPSGPLADKVIQ